MAESKDIYSIFDKMLPRADKEERLKQRSLVIWMYGLSGSGKSTIANALERKLFEEGFFTQILDGDNIRTGLNCDLSFTDDDRKENIRRVANVAKLFAHAGVITIVSFITPTESLRKLAGEVVGKEDFMDVYAHCSFEECAKRDPKGLYAKALRGEVENFTGKDSLFENPKNPQLMLDTEKNSLEQCLDQIYQIVIGRIKA